MFKKNNFAIKLSKEKIELLKKHDEGYFTLCTVNPNSINLNSDLSSLLKQYQAISNEKKIVDVILPDELIIKQNILTNEEISFKKAAILLAKNCDMSSDELNVISGPISSNRSQTIVAVTKKSIKEAKDFVKSIGFIPQNFFSLKYIPEIPNDLVFFSEKIKNDIEYFKIINKHKLKVISFLVFFPITIYFIFFSNTFLTNKTIVENNSKTLLTKAPLQKVFNEENKLLKEKVFKVFPPYANTKNKSLLTYKKTFVDNKKIFIKKYEKFNKKSSSGNSLIYILNKNEIIEKNKKFLYNFLERNKKDEKSRNRKLVQLIKQDTIKKNIENKWATNIKKNLINTESKILFNKNNFSKKETTVLFLVPSIIKPKTINILNLYTFKNEDDFNFTNLIESQNITENKKVVKFKNEEIKKLFSLNTYEIEKTEFLFLNKKINKDKIIITDKNLFYVEELNEKKSIDNITNLYEIRPLKRPLLISNIKVLKEPTISSGAVAFSINPQKRPEFVKTIVLSKNKEAKIVSLTRGPRIPSNASVSRNATIPNIFELNRTNLIGTFGTTNNPLALIKLASGKVIKVKIGDNFDGWKVYAIEKEKIFVTNGIKREVLRIPG